MGKRNNVPSSKHTLTRGAIKWMCRVRVKELRFLKGNAPQQRHAMILSFSRTNKWSLGCQALLQWFFFSCLLGCIFSTQRGGSLQLRTSFPSPFAVLLITNNGCGDGGTQSLAIVGGLSCQTVPSRIYLPFRLGAGINKKYAVGAGAGFRTLYLFTFVSGVFLFQCNVYICSELVVLLFFPLCFSTTGFL